MWPCGAVPGGIVVNGIFYDPKSRQLRHLANGCPGADWSFVTHDLGASEHRLRRILREWLPADVLSSLDYSRCNRPTA